LSAMAQYHTALAGERQMGSIAQPESSLYYGAFTFPLAGFPGGSESLGRIETVYLGPQQVRLRTLSASAILARGWSLSTDPKIAQRATLGFGA
jgi:hypothetical protein